MQIINDTTLYSSINSYRDTANFFLRNDSLFIEQKYYQTDGTGTIYIERLYDYKIIASTPDTLKLKNNFHSDNSEDSIVFVNIEKIKEPTNDFKYLKLHLSGPFSGDKVINIDKHGNVFYSFIPVPYSINRPDVDKNARSKKLQERLTKTELETFKNILSKAAVSRLPLKRSCHIDGQVSEFQIMIGNKLYKSSGCDLVWTQSFLLIYLYDIDTNKNFQTTKR